MRVVEAALVTVSGSALSAAPALLLDLSVAVVVATAVVGGANGLLSGGRQVYDWRSWTGWLAFVLDSTWGLLGTALGLFVHTFNFAHRRAGYRAVHSRRRNRHVYERGFALKRGYVVALGNVISNASGGIGSIEDRPGRMRLIDEHEDLHVWQNRIFGALMQATYVVWAAGGILYGAAFWVLHRHESLSSIVMTTVYYDNPFEYWAYRKQRYWPPLDSHPRVRWPGRVE